MLSFYLYLFACIWLHQVTVRQTEVVAVEKSKSSSLMTFSGNFEKHGGIFEKVIRTQHILQPPLPPYCSWMAKWKLQHMSAVVTHEHMLSWTVSSLQWQCRWFWRMLMLKPSTPAHKKGSPLLQPQTHVWGMKHRSHQWREVGRKLVKERKRKIANNLWSFSKWP